MSESEKIAAALEADPLDAASASAIDEEDRLRPEFVDRVLDAVDTGDDETARELVAPLHPADVADLIERGSSPRSPYFDDMRQMTLPAQALLIRRMEGLVFSSLGELRAKAYWGALAREYYDDAPPATALGEQDAAFWAEDRRPAAA